jgi:hypothetical protein
MDECEFGGIGNKGEHAFAEEGIAKTYTIESTNEALVFEILRMREIKIIILPYFYTDSHFHAVEFGVGFYHIWTKPSTFLFVA